MDAGGIISPISDAVGAADTIVSRLEQRAKDKDARLRERDDVRDALLDLFHLLRQWQRAAELTNELANDVQPDGTLPYTRDYSLAKVRPQSRAAAEAFYFFGYPGNGLIRPQRAAKASVSDVLAVYAPEAEQQLARALAERREAVEQFREALEANADGGTVRRAAARLLGRNEKQQPWTFSDADRTQLAATLDALNEATARLQRFIRDTFAVEQLQVRAPD